MATPPVWHQRGNSVFDSLKELWLNEWTSLTSNREYQLSTCHLMYSCLCLATRCPVVFWAYAANHEELRLLHPHAENPLELAKEKRINFYFYLECISQVIKEATINIYLCCFVKRILIKAKRVAPAVTAGPCIIYYVFYRTNIQSGSINSL